MVETESIRGVEKKYCSRAMMLAITLAIILIAIGYKAMAKGLILGSLFSVVNFIIMGRTLPMRLNRTKRKTFFIGLGSIWFRYIVLAIPLVLAIKMEQFDVLAACAGIFMIQVMILSDQLFTIITKKFSSGTEDGES